MTAAKRYILGAIPSVQLAVFVTLLVLEYLSGYRAGVMQHIYIQKISLYNQFYDGYMLLHATVIAVLGGYGLCIVPKKPNASRFIVDKAMMLAYAGLWLFLARLTQSPEAWPPHSHFLLFCECACFSQIGRMTLRRLWT